MIYYYLFLIALKVKKGGWLRNEVQVYQVDVTVTLSLAVIIFSRPESQLEVEFKFLQKFITYCENSEKNTVSLIVCLVYCIFFAQMDGIIASVHISYNFRFQVTKIYVIF